MFEKPSVCRALAGVAFCVALLAGPMLGQEATKKGGSVPITFVPPPIENATYSVGIYEAKSGKLVRRLCEAAGQDTFKIGLNGLITSWDGKDDDAKSLPPGKYAARGYALGPLKVEGEAILGNDWAANDESLRVTRVEAIGLVPEDDGLIAMVTMTDDGYTLLRFSGKDGALLWKKPLPFSYANRRPLPYGLILVDDAAISLTFVGETHSYHLSNGEPIGGAVAGKKINDDILTVEGKDGTVWLPTVDGLVQLQARSLVDGKIPEGTALDKLVLRGLPADPGGLRPERVAASKTHDKLYVLEDASGQQRVRGLSWVETKEEAGKQVSTWQTFFERSIGPPDPSTGLENAFTANAPSATIEVTLEENALAPGKHEHAKLTATFDNKGSYLAVADGLRLRQISERGHLRAVKLTKSKESSALSLFQSDGAAWDEFSIDGLKAITSFDAGEFEINAAGEKPNAEKVPEPDL